MKKVVVVGGGPAGMIAAAEAAKAGADTTIIEKNEKLGKKLYITGKGRCNLTNDCEEAVFLQNVPGNPYFLYSAIYSFNSQALMSYMEALGVKLKVERGNRVFPLSDKSSDIIKALEKNLKAYKVKVRLNTNVADVITENGSIKGVTADTGAFFCDKLIIATGGISYPMTGSTGDGYRFAKKCGHEVTNTYPSLVPLLSKEQWVKSLAGLSLKNVSVRLHTGRGKPADAFGEMIFTHTGVSGPVVLTLSRELAGANFQDVKLIIDLKPALSHKELDQRILRDFEKNINRDYKNALDELLPQKLIPVIIKLSEIDPEKKVNGITRGERNRLVDLIKGLAVPVSGTAGYHEAVVTAGGVSVDGIDPGTMESKLVSGLFFAGEVLDVDGYTGGFNLQIAFATGFMAGGSR